MLTQYNDATTIPDNQHSEQLTKPKTKEEQLFTQVELESFVQRNRERAQSRPHLSRTLKTAQLAKKLF